MHKAMTPVASLADLMKTGRNRDSTLAFERERGLANVVVDGPQGFGTSVPAVWEVTSPELAIVRMHGRNVDTWAKKGLTSSSQQLRLLGSRARPNRALGCNPRAGGARHACGPQQQLRRPGAAQR